MGSRFRTFPVNLDTLFAEVAYVARLPSGGCHAHRDRNRGPGPMRQSIIRPCHGEQREPYRIEPQQVAITVLENMGDEKGRRGHDNTGQKIGRLLDPENRLYPKQHIADRAPANARHAAQQSEANNIHLFPRGDQSTRHRENTQAKPIKHSDEIM